MACGPSMILPESEGDTAGHRISNTNKQILKSPLGCYNFHGGLIHKSASWTEKTWHDLPICDKPSLNYIACPMRIKVGSTCPFHSLAAS